VKRVVENLFFNLVEIIPRECRAKLAKMPFVYIYREIVKTFGASEDVGFREINAGPLKGRKLFIGSTDERGYISVREYIKGFYEPLVTDAIIKYCAPGRVAIDIGAHYGYFSLLMAQCSGKMGKCIAFEANEINYQKIFKSVDSNPDVNLIIEHKAISDKNGQVSFVIHKNSLMGHIIDRDTKYSESNVEFVETCTIDWYLNQREQTNVSLIKIDVEGSELMVIQGCIETIRRYKPILLIEVHKFPGFEVKATSMVKTIISMNYEINYIGTEIKVDPELLAGGYIIAIPLDDNSG
jgi:FkbM family methyltransferase